MNSVDKNRLKENLESLNDEYNTIELYGDAIEEVLELMDDFNQIVHCSECKNRLTDHCPVNKTKEYLDDDWYCADGEKW